MSGDPEEIIAVLSRDLSHGYSYVRIAEVYRAANEPDKALEWAVKGLEAFPDNRDSRLEDFAAEDTHRRHRHDDAMKLIWAQFAERPHLHTYLTLELHATKSGNCRSGAIAHWPKSGSESRSHAPRRNRAGCASMRIIPKLVEIYLYEKNSEAAWREAQEGGCSDALWLQLADARQQDDPADAAPTT